MDCDYFIVERRLALTVLAAIEKLLLRQRERGCFSGRSPSTQAGGCRCRSPRLSQILVEACALGLRERICGYRHSLTVYFGWVRQCSVDFWVLGYDLRVPEPFCRQKYPGGSTMKIQLATWSWQESPTNYKSNFDTIILRGGPKGLWSKRTTRVRQLGRKLSMRPQSGHITVSGEGEMCCLKR